MPKESPEKLPDKPRSIKWKGAVDLWLAEVRRIRRDSTTEGYFGVLDVAELKSYHSLVVRDITRESMAEAIAATAAREKERQAETSAVAVRGPFAYLGSDAMRSKTAVIEGAMEKPRRPSAPSTKTRRTTVRTI